MKTGPASRTRFLVRIEDVVGFADTVTLLTFSPRQVCHRSHQLEQSLFAAVSDDIVGDGRVVAQRVSAFVADENREEAYYWARATMHMGVKLLQNSGVVVITHDGSGIFDQ
jgi:hypothetical protein